MKAFVWPKIFTHKKILIVIFIIGTFFRFYNLNWDQGQFFHPDEYNILQSIEKISVPDGLDPQFYAYNGLNLYIDKILITGSDFLFPGNSSKTYNYAVVFRSLSALVSSISIILIYYLGKELKNRKVGLIAAFIFAFTPTLIQHAHFYVTESMLIFLFLWLGLSSLRILQKNNFKNWILVSIPFGLSVGCKLSALSYIIIPFFTLIILITRSKNLKVKMNNISRFSWFSFISFLIFFAVSPYTLLNSTKFVQSAFGYENAVVQGTIKVPYTIQFEHTTPFVFQITNLFWQMGLFIPILGIIGLFVWIYLIYLKKISINSLPFLFFGVLYFIYICTWYAKFIRYTLPSIPIFIISSSIFLYYIFTFKVKYVPSFVLKGMVLFMLFSTFIWSLMNMSIYFTKSTRISASEWIYQNIPNRSSITGEAFDYTLPASFGENGNTYSHDFLNVYENDSLDKMNRIATQLSKSDYLIIASRRAYPNIQKNNNTYPFTSNYYDQLFKGQLGFEQIKEINSYPSIGPIKIVDDNAEETFQVFDHPRILIFKNILKLSKDQLFDIIG